MTPAALRLDPPTQRPRLGWFVLASLALHGLLLAGWSAVRPVNFGEARGQSTTVTLEAVLARPQPKPAAKPNKEKPHPITHTSKPHPQHVLAVRHPSEPTHEVVAKQTTEPAPVPQPVATEKSASTPAVGAERRHHLLGRIRLALADHFHYPLQARRLGWQGTVLLGFRLTPHGRIEAIRVEHSSGYNQLDEAAITALGQVQQLPPDEPTLVSSLDLTLPVIYRIEER